MQTSNQNYSNINTETINLIQTAQKNREFTPHIPFKNGISLKLKVKYINWENMYLPITPNPYVFEMIRNDIEKCEKVQIA